ncbi:hypothetical protein [Ralstonia insidiosa]|uniref:Uncharacterized protein n=1 Tax=Ralstonia insidiosa TaxID=190721 RepID=A0A848PAZ3_9RALS|nr:hypothetical protein [Ralstonia insidiosa]NMV41766.1 hypothetical protein [Ralstonia insidiosa]
MLIYQGIPKKPGVSLIRHHLQEGSAINRLQSLFLVRQVTWLGIPTRKLPAAQVTPWRARLAHHSHPFDGIKKAPLEVLFGADFCPEFFWMIPKSCAAMRSIRF